MRRLYTYTTITWQQRPYIAKEIFWKLYNGNTKTQIVNEIGISKKQYEEILNENFSAKNRETLRNWAAKNAQQQRRKREKN